MKGSILKKPSLKKPEDLLLDEEPTEDDQEISVRTFNAKFIKQLNFQQNQKQFRERRKVQMQVIFSLKQIHNGLKNFVQNSVDYSPHKVDSPDRGERKKTMSKSKRKNQTVLKDGTRVKAEFRNQQIHGEAEMYYTSGSKFVGRYESGIRVSGKFDFNNGYKYEGGFHGDKFHGLGVLTLPNNKKISGEWSQNQVEGKAQITYPSGDLYYGEINKFKKHGEGYMFFKNGDKYIGQFFNGEISGFGQFFQNQKLVAKGVWKNGELIQPFEEGQENPSSLQTRKSIDTKEHSSDEILNESLQSSLKV